MTIELINTGSELMLGRVLNTHQQWICRQLADAGWVVDRQTAVDDTPQAIGASVQEALSRADVVLVTGGLGPTSDDRTRTVIASLLGRALHCDALALANLEQFFQSRGRPVPESARVQAMAPEGALVLQNSHGTAPGLWMEAPRPGPAGAPVILVMLPGPPRELYPMFTAQVLPLLRERLPGQESFVCRTLRSTGVPESIMEELVAPALQEWVDQGLELGYCARPGEVDVRLAARGPEAARVVAQAARIVLERAGDSVFGEDDQTLEQAVVRELRARKRTLATAESCTGGLIASRITDVPGASDVFWGGLVTYANAAKEQLAGVQEAALKEHGAVSETVVRQMAQGARARCGTDYALAVTGVAGPGGGTPAKPVGTVFVGLAGPEGTQARAFRNPFERETFKAVTTRQALEMLRRALLKETPAAAG